MKKFVALMLSLALVLSCCAAMAASGTYTVFFPTEELSGNVEHTGFIAGTGAGQKNTLVLNEDGTYVYTKYVSHFDENLERKADAYFDLTFVYTGTYEEDGNTITLKAPVDCEFTEDWGALSSQGFLNSAGKASEGAVVECKEGTTHDPMLMFPGPFYKDAPEMVDVVVTINEDGTFAYAAVANSDDD